MKHMLRLAILACLACGAALAQTTDELVNDGRNADNVTDRRAWATPAAATAR